MVHWTAKVGKDDEELERLERIEKTEELVDRIDLLQDELDDIEALLGELSGGQSWTDLDYEYGEREKKEAQAKFRIMDLQRDLSEFKDLFEDLRE